MREGTIGAIQSPLQADLDRVAESISLTLDVDVAQISVAHHAYLVALGLATNVTSMRTKRYPDRQDLLCCSVVDQDAPTILPDARNSPDHCKNLYVENGFVAGYVGVPIRNAEIGAIGAVCAVTAEPRDWQARDIEYLKATALTVENMILREMYRLESADASDLASEYDKIIAAFSLVRADATSIHDRTGRLVFANTALTVTVSEAELESDGVRDMLARPMEDNPVQVRTMKSGMLFRVHRAVTSSGYIVCQWQPERSRMN